jgi:chromate transport protein ChrA
MHGYEKVKNISMVNNFVKGITVTSVGLIFYAVVGIGQDTLIGPIPWTVFVLTIFLSKIAKLNGFISFILSSIVGVVLYGLGNI